MKQLGITEIYEYEKSTTYIHVNWKYELIKDSKFKKINYWYYTPFNIFSSFYNSKLQNTRHVMFFNKTEKEFSL